MWLALIKAQAVREELTTILPASYGIATGYLVNKHGQCSMSIDLIVYDRTISSNLAPDEAHQVELRRALAVVMLLHELDTDELDGTLQAIASVKALRPIQQLRPSQGQKSAGGIQKSLFPLGIV